MAILVGRNEEEQKSLDWFIRDWQQALLALDASLDIRVWPEIGNKDDIEFLLVWNHPLGVLTQFPNIKAIASLAAGVDHVLADNNVDKAVPIVRVTDTYMANDIVQYVAAYALSYIKQVPHWALKQQQKIWYKQPPFTLAEKTIGIMGLGFLGSKAAFIFQQMGLKVIGWSNSPKMLPDVKSYTGEAELAEFLSQTGILICMLPLTNKTRHILNEDTFSKLPRGCYLINVGRGQQLVEQDLLNALASGQLSGACLDVFTQEPLPADHPFWSHPNVIITPHIASVTNAATVAPQVLSNYRNALNNLPLANPVDLLKGY